MSTANTAAPPKSTCSFGILERTRQLHAHVEHLRKEIVAQLLLKPQHPHHQTIIDHFVFQKMTQIELSNRTVLQTYDSEEMEGVVRCKDDWQSQHHQHHHHQREATAAAPGGGSGTSIQQILKDFTGKVASIKEYDNRFKQAPYGAPQLEEPSTDYLSTTHKVLFSGPERGGTCMDVATAEFHEAYIRFLDASKNYGSSGATAIVTERDISFQSFATALAGGFRSIPWQRKAQAFASYSDLVARLTEYVVDFFFRVRPLNFSIAAKKAQSLADTAQRWESGKVEGWESPAARQVKVTAAATGRAATGSGGDALSTAQNEAVLRLYLDELEIIVHRTVRLVERRRTKLPEELAKEVEQEEQDVSRSFAVCQGIALPDSAPDDKKLKNGDGDDQYHDQDDEEEDEAVTENLKNLPIDPGTGEPMSLWLFKLQQLDKKKFCKICNHEYPGPVAFKHHFREPRHLAGLERLSIPPSLIDMSFFSTITDPEVALTMYRNLTVDAKSKRIREADEEVADHSGHVLTREGLRDHQQRKMMQLQQMQQLHPPHQQQQGGGGMTAGGHLY